MADPIPFDQQAEELKLRSPPKPVTQINKKVVTVGAAAGVLLLFLAASVALDPPKVSGDQEPRELYNTRNKATADGLAALPASYDQLPQKTAILPILGPPAAGDMGAPLVALERELGIQPQLVHEPVRDFWPDAEVEAERAERIRLAKLEQESLEAPLFFQVRGDRTPRETASPRPQQTDPFAALNEASAAYAAAGLPGSPATQDQNLQSQKLAFASDAAEGDIYNRHGIVDPASPYQVMAGTIIPASLITGLNSDLPGTIIAQVTQPVYDTVSGSHQLIPQGSRLIGRYDSRVSFGQERALVVWGRIIFPNGSSIQIDALPGSDVGGYAGLSDRVDNHWGRAFTAAGLATLLGVGSELAFDDDDDEIARAIRDGVQDTTNQAGQRVVDRNLNIQPTLKVRPGWPLRVIVTRDLILRPYS